MYELFGKAKETNVVYVSGAHGCGKTTVIDRTAKRLQRAGLSVYVFPEMSYIPDIELGTVVFQHWYTSDMETREYLINRLVEMNIYDYILADRHPHDIAIYSQRLVSRKHEKKYKDCFRYLKRDTDIWIVLFRTYEDTMASIKKRIEEEPHRAEWNETDSEYLTNIMHDFVVTLPEFSAAHMIHNNDLDQCVEDTMLYILKEVM